MTTEAADLKALYRQTVLEHSRQPHHFGRLEMADQTATGHNPLCGDKCNVYLRVNGDSLADVTFEGVGCAICMASASIMTDVVNGLRLTDVEQAAADVLTAFDSQQPDNSKLLQGDMAALSGVKNFPTRIRCATLPWKTLMAALQNSSDTVTTESND